MAQSAREKFRWAFQEQLRTRLWETQIDDRVRQMVESGAMDAFDYVWREYGLDSLNIEPVRDRDK